MHLPWVLELIYYPLKKGPWPSQCSLWEYPAPKPAPRWFFPPKVWAWRSCCLCPWRKTSPLLPMNGIRARELLTIAYPVAGPHTASTPPKVWSIDYNIYSYIQTVYLECCTASYKMLKTCNYVGFFIPSLIFYTIVVVYIIYTTKPQYIVIIFVQ